MTKDLSIQDMKKRYERLTAQLAQIGYVIAGTITERTVVGRAGKKQIDGKQYGPYHQWTRKIDGKTRTRNLSEKEVQEYQKAIDNNRRVEDIIREMRVLSQNILEQQLVGVKKRKRT
jgi:hypothetical protein